jgi:uncharacterized protein (TIGR02246 family)
MNAKNSKDEQAIHELVEAWWTASRTHDVESLMGLMADDVVFMVAGREPFGKREFAETVRNMKDVRIEGGTRILELEVLDERAWMRAHITVMMSFPSGQRDERSGYVLSLLRKEANGNWVVFREANLLPEMRPQEGTT